MASNLKARFHERQRKCLFESIIVNSNPSKKVSLEPVSVPPPVPVHLIIAAGIIPESDEKILSTNVIAHHEPMRPFIGPYHFSDESFQYLVSSLPCPKSTYVPNEEEVSKLLRRIISFIERETLIQNMRVLFPATQRILVEIDNDPSRDRQRSQLIIYDTTSVRHSGLRHFP